MKTTEIRNRFLSFFKKNGHKIIPSASIVPENDPTVLFTTAGMHPLVPYLLGENHPMGNRLTNCQKCVRTNDIDEVGDTTHLTFFEMLGNWSLGDYFKEQAIKYSFSFLTSSLEDNGLGLPLNKIAITCFSGDKNAPKDVVTAKIWQNLGVPAERIAFLPKENNWWGPAGKTGPCGPDTEMFFWTGKDSPPQIFDPKDTKWVEIWNDVFMEYNKNENGDYEPLTKKNVDTGMGLERVAAIMQNVDSIYDTDLFLEALLKINELTTINTNAESILSKRVILDHLRSATFILADKIKPSNVDQGYILRRLIRRAVRHAFKLGINDHFCYKIAEIFINKYKDIYPELNDNKELIIHEFNEEESKFKKTLIHGEKEFEKILPNLLKNEKKILPGRLAFRLYDTYGFPIEMTKELAKEQNLIVDESGFTEAFKKHQELSRAGAEEKFKGGLADNSKIVTCLHTATHLLHQALINVLGDHVQQRGSNITAERLRFDFVHPDKMSPEQLKKVEDIVNEQIKKNLMITVTEMSVEDAKKSGAIGLFEHKYGEKIKVYAIGDFSKEICGGPHANNTAELGKFKILKEQSSSSGVRRIKAVLL